MIAQNTLKIQRFQCFQAIFPVSEYSQSRYRAMRLWLLDLQPLHEPTVLLRRQCTRLGFAPWPLVRALFQTFVQQNEAVLFPVQALDAVSPPPTEQEQCVGEWIQLKLLLDHSGQTVYAFAQIGIAAGDVDLVGPGKVVQHDFKIRSIVSTVVVSAPEWISTVAPAM